METPAGLRAAVADGVIRVTLCAGDGENRVTPEMVGWLQEILEHPPGETHIVHLCADGPVFCLGPQPPGPGGSIRELGRSLAGLNRALMATSMVTVAQIDGVAAGFGAGLACLPDITIAGEDATFVFPEIDHRLSPALVLSWLGEYIGPKAAGWMTLTGQPVDAGEAFKLGLVSQVVPSAQLERVGDDLVVRLGAFDQACLLEIKRFLRDRHGLPRRGAEELAIERMAAWADRRSQS